MLLTRRRVFARSVGFENTKIVLMSATPNVKLLCDYFSVPERSVVDVSRGIRKHELVIYFAEHLADPSFHLPLVRDPFLLPL